MLSVTLSSIGGQSVFAGAPLNVALDGESENPLSYTVEVSNANLTATVFEDNPSIRIAIDDDANDIHGNVTIQLFEDLVPDTVDRIMALIDSGYYDGLTFHRIIDDFMIQGGDPDGDGTGGPGFQFDDEFTSELQFTSAGLLAMANSGDDTNGSQFFITLAETRWLDFQHTIFGMVTEGMDIVEQLSEVSVDVSHAPLSDVIMTSVTVVDDVEDAVLRLSASDGATGTADVTVTVTDTVTSETTTETFQVTVAADTTNNLPYLEQIAPIITGVNTPVTVDIPATDVEGDEITYSASVSPVNANLTVSIDENTGELTVTPSNGVYGVFSILVGVRQSTSNNWDTQYVPVYVNPAPPTGVALVSTSDTGGSDSDAVTNLNNSAGQTLEFEIEGVAIGTLVELFADGELIGQTTAVGTTLTIVTDGTTTLTDGTHEFTVKQTLLDEAVDVGNLETTIDLESDFSTPLTVTIDTVGPVITSNPVTTAYEEETYIHQVSAEDDTGDVAFSLDQAPTGMTIDPDTGRITWTSITGAGTTEQVVVKVADTAGNVAEQTFDLTIAGPNTTPVLTPAAPEIGATDQNTTTTFSLTATFINNGEGTTIITDADQSDAVGGIAVVGLAGNGVWSYSLDGTTFTDIGDVSETSALLLPADASLRYTPDGENGETATISYAAWDGTTGHDGISAVDTTSGGDHSAFSLESDTASLTVTTATGSISGFVYVDTDNDGLRVTPGGQSHLAMQGVVVRLLAADGEGNWTQLSSVSSGADGSYRFDNLTPGTYRMQEVQPAGYLDGKDTLGTIGGTVRGALAQDQFEIQLGANENAVEYNFGERGLLPGSISLRFCLASAPAMPQNVTPVDTDQTPPAGYSISADDGLISAAEAATTGFTFSGAEVGTTYNYTVASSGGAGTASGTGTIVSATQQVASIDVSALPDGELTFSVTLTDAMGNTGFAATAAATLDQTAPAGYSVGLSDDRIDETEAPNTFFQISGGEVGAAFSYTITSDGGAGSVAGNGTITSTAQVISGIDVSGLPDGTLTFSVILTDAAGNVGAAETAATTLDQDAPAGYSITTDDDLIGAAEAATTSFTFAGAEPGTTYNYTVTSAGGDGEVTGSGTITSADEQVMGIDVSNLPDGILTFSVTLTDAGNKTGAAVTAAAMLDKTAPAGYTIAPYDDVVDADTATDTGFWIIDAEPFTTYVYTITSDGGEGSVTGYGTTTLSDYPVNDIDVSSLPDGLLTISVTLMDAAGNVGVAATATATLDQSGS